MAWIFRMGLSTVSTVKGRIDLKTKLKWSVWLTGLWSRLTISGTPISTILCKIRKMHLCKVTFRKPSKRDQPQKQNPYNLRKPKKWKWILRLWMACLVYSKTRKSAALSTAWSLMNFKVQRSTLIDNVLLQKQRVIMRRKKWGEKLRKTISFHASRM